MRQDVNVAEKILLVDDDVRILKSLARYLRGAGYQVKEASDGDEAARLFTEDRFDLVLSDVMMPGINGVELLERIRTVAPEIPVVLISGFADWDRSLAIKRGAADLIMKPFDPADLVSRLKYLLQR